MSNRPADPVTDYARSIALGRTVAGRLVRLAAQRHLDDLEYGAARGLRFDAVSAQRVLDFFGMLNLPDGNPFKVQPSQAFIVGSLFGWKGADGYRRFRTAYVEQAKGSGKSPMAAAIGLYGLVADGEGSPEIYAAATTYKQAGILFRDAKAMVEASPSLRKRLGPPGLYSIAYAAKNGFFQPVSGEHKGLDGPRPHIALIDELHEHPTALVADKIRAGTKSRKQALIVEITNSGHDRTSVCWQHREYSERVLEGILEDDSWFAFVCHLDPCEQCRQEGKSMPSDECSDCDQWDDEAVWPKANPTLDAVLPRKYLREQVREAKGMPSKEYIVKRLNLCIWTQAAAKAVPMDRWDACSRTLDLAELEGRDCFAGLDIGATSDFTALTLLFPHDDAEEVEVPAANDDAPPLVITRRSYTLLPYFWQPERPRKRDERTDLLIKTWQRQGHVRTSGGDVVDYDLVLEDIGKLADRYSLRRIAFDRGFQGASMGTNLMTRFGAEVVVSYPQGLLSMAAPFREFIELLKVGRLHHGGHPVMRWMCSNCMATSRNGLSMPSKDHSSEKIDGVSALVMALGVALTAPPEPVCKVEVWK